jgi:hypothetical protein
MSSKNLITSLITAVILAGAAYFIYQYFENRRMNVNTDGTIDATALYLDFTTNKDAAFAKYADKTIKIKGIVASQNKEGGATVVNCDTGNAQDAVACILDIAVNHQKTTFEAGEEVVFNGICNGMIDNEVRISNCVISK